MTRNLMIAVAVYFAAIAQAFAFECRGPQDALARVAYYEARGEGELGMRLVAEVALNRVNDEKFPSSICAVVKQRGQFSWVGRTSGTPNGASWERAKKIARQTLAEGSKHTDALFFRAGGGSKCMNRSRKMKHGAHSFY